MALPKVPTILFDVDIPSTKTKTKIRPMLTKEEKILLIAKEGGDDQEIMTALKQIVQTCLVDKTININNLTIFDLEYLFLRISAVSITNKIKLSYKDMEDEKTRDFEVDLDTINIVFPEKDLSHIEVSPNLSIDLRYPPASLYDDKGFLETTGEKVYDELVYRCVASITDGDQKFDPKLQKPEELKAWIDTLPVAVYKQIKEFLGSLPSLKYTITYTNDLNNERKIELTTLNDFFSLR